jgi:hypothetical protein
MNVSELTAEQKAYLWVLADMEDLVEKGYVARGAGAPALTDGGRAAVAELEAAGYEPTKDEIAMAVRHIAGRGKPR